MSSSAGYRLLYFSCLIAISVAFFVGTYFVIEIAKKTHEDEVVNLLKTTSYHAKHRIMEMVGGTEASLELVASRTNMRRIMGLIENDPSPENYRVLQKILDDAILSAEYVVALALFDNHGRLIVSTNTQFYEKHHVQLEKKVDVIGSGKSILISRIKTLTYNQRRVGVVSVIFSGEFINGMVYQREGLGKTGEWLLAKRGDKNQAIFITDRLYANIYGAKNEINNSKKEIPITQALLKNETLLRMAPDYRGEPVMAYTRYIPQLDWGLVAKIDESEIDEFVSAIRVKIVLTILPIFTVIFIVNYILLLRSQQQATNVEVKSFSQIEPAKRKSALSIFEQIIRKVPIFYLPAWDNYLEQLFKKAKEENRDFLLVKVHLSQNLEESVESSDMIWYTFTQLLVSLFSKRSSFQCDIFMNDKQQYILFFNPDSEFLASDLCNQAEWILKSIKNQLARKEIAVNYLASAINNQQKTETLPGTLTEVDLLFSRRIVYDEGSVIRDIVDFDYQKRTA